MDSLKTYINDVPNWPIDGVTFKDLTPLLADPSAYNLAIESMSAICADIGSTHIVSPDARGWLFASPIAHINMLPLHVVRKPGKLPPDTISKTYDYEYASGELEMKAHLQFPSNASVTIVDDVSATGGTALAIIDMLRDYGVSKINYVSLIDLKFLQGTAKLKQTGVHCYSVITYD